MFDPTKPAHHTPANSAEMRAQLNGLKELIDALTAQLGALDPVGTIKAWDKNLPGVPPLTANWVECNGQTVSDAESPLNGVTLPNLNSSQLFLRGSATSGVFGGVDYFATRPADNASIGIQFNAVTIDDSPGAAPIPPFYAVVWVMRVK
jgi:hypothetical protein